MIEHVWTVVCSHSVIDTDSNNITLQNVVEQLTIGGEPTPTGVVPIPLEIVTLWARADFDIPSRGRARWTFLSPSDPVAAPNAFEVDLSVFPRSRTRTRLQGLPIREPGRHVFRVELQQESETEWREVAAIPLQIVFSPPGTE